MSRRWLRVCKWPGLALLALLGSFLLNWALAPVTMLPRAKDYRSSAMPPDVRGQLNYFYAVWDDPARLHDQLQSMHDQNPEWDLISRTFFGYALANVALQYPAEKERALACLDRIISESTARPWRSYLLPYGNDEPFVHQPARSIMVDGELALLIGLRRLVDDPPDYPYRDLQLEYVQNCLDAMQSNPLHIGESYPDECWLFCNPLALAAIKVSDVLEGTDHTAFFKTWERTARHFLVDPKTGLFNAAVTLDGRVKQIPEGSTIWIGVHGLVPVLPGLAREQYDLMRQKLSGDLVCFSYGREWPKGIRQEWDIDSGFTPFGLGPASTGFALIPAKDLHDDRFFTRLLGLLNVVGVPAEEHGELRYQSSNFVGDAIFLYGKVTGPAWAEVARRDPHRKAAP